MFDADRSTSNYRWPVLRLSDGNKCELILLSSRFFAVTTHWVGHTVLCCVDNCDLCEILPSRGLFYFAAHVLGRNYLVELGSQSAGHLEQHAKLLNAGMKPGQVYELRRMGKKQPVRSEVVRFQEGVSEVPHLTLAQRVMALYRYPGPNPSESLEQYESRVFALCRRRCEGSALSLKAAVDRGAKSRR